MRERVSEGAEEGRETKSERIYIIYMYINSCVCVCVCRKDTNESVGGHFAPWGSISTIFGSIYRVWWVQDVYIIIIL